MVIVDYKMKLELGVRTREIQRDWYGTPNKMLGSAKVLWMLASAGWKRSSLAFKCIYFLVSIQLSYEINTVSN